MNQTRLSHYRRCGELREGAFGLRLPSREAWAEALAELGRRIDYSNTKHAVFERQAASRYEQAMHEVWSVFARPQPDRTDGEGSSRYPPTPEGERARRRSSDGGGR